VRCESGCDAERRNGFTVCEECLGPHVVKMMDEISALGRLNPEEFRRHAEACVARLMASWGGMASAASLAPDQRKSRASAAGRASAARLTPEQRSERARKAVAVRWSRAREDMIKRVP